MMILHGTPYQKPVHVEPSPFGPGGPPPEGMEPGGPMPGGPPMPDGHGGPGGPGGPGPAGPMGPNLKAHAFYVLSDGTANPALEKAQKGEMLTNVVFSSQDPDEGCLHISGKESHLTLCDGKITLEGNGCGLGGKSSGASAENYGELTIRNSTITTTGAFRSATAAEEHAKLWIYDSTLIANGAPFGNGAPALASPPAALEIDGNCRTHITMANSESYFYDCKVIANGWAALSTDSAKGYVYLEANDTLVKTVQRGYGVYADSFCHVAMNRCQIEAADMAAIVAGEADITMTDTVSDCGTYFALIHCIGMPEELSTMKLSGCKIICRKPAFLIKSQNADLYLRNTTVASASGILLRTIWNDDPNAAKTNGETVYGVHLHLTDCTLSGDVLHEDPERETHVLLENTALRGSIQNVYLSLDKGSKWFATGDSTVTLENTAAISQFDAPQGVTITLSAQDNGNYPLPSGGMLKTVIE